MQTGCSSMPVIAFFRFGQCLIKVFDRLIIIAQFLAYKSQIIQNVMVIFVMKVYR